MERDERYEVNAQGKLVIGKPVTLTPNERKSMIEKMFSINGWKYTVLQEITSSHYHIKLENSNLDISKTFHLYHGNIRKEDPERNREEKKIQLGTENDPRNHMDDALILGFYVYENKDSLDDTVIVAWPIEEEKNYPANPSLRVNMRTNIQVAKNTGYYVDKVTGKKLVAFRPEFIYYYIENYKNLHYSGVTSTQLGENDEINISEVDESSSEINSGYIPLVFNTDIDFDFEDRNRIVFGAPGTGKSYGLKKDCETLLSDKEGTYERVTFHPDYSYSQFVGTYKPVMDEDGKSIRYDFVPGPFMRVYVDALKSGRTDAPQPHLLIIEEINRAKVAAVFGDVFQLLDRDENGVSEYEIQATEDIRRYLAKELSGSVDNYQRIRIPNNMFIWSTMNSADQGVFPMDTAFKRRWNFEYLGINENEEQIEGIGKIVLGETDELIEWNMLRKAINNKMSSSDFKINEDKLMGPFFLSKKVIKSDEEGMIIDTQKFIKAFKSKVIMYLYEDAVKQGKHRFFEGCPDTSKYSSICDAFDEIGINIFGATFREEFYDVEKDD